MQVSAFNLKRKISFLLPDFLKAPLKRYLYTEAEKKNSWNFAEDQRVRKLPRYVRSQTNLLGKQIQILDAPSFLSLKQELFEKEIYKFTTQSESPFIIDAAANIGMSAIYFKNLYPNAKILAFEPDPKVFDILKFNLNQFRFQNVTIVPKGLWDVETTLKFYSEGADAGRIPSAGDNGNLISIETTMLSTYINQRVDFLKIDIEGAEYEVLKESQSKLHLVDKIFIEYHSFENQEQSLPEILQILKTNGFRIYLSTPGVFSSNPFKEVKTYLNMDLQVNIFGLRN